MKDKNLISEDVMELDTIKDKMEVILNDIGLYFDNSVNCPQSGCERTRYNMEITRIGIMCDYINNLEKIINDMYEHLK